MLCFLLFITATEAADFRLGAFEYVPVGLEKLFGDGFDAEGLFNSLAHGLALYAIAVPQVGYLLGHGSLDLTAIGNQALEPGPTASQVGTDDVQLVAITVGEEEEQLVIQRPGQYLRRSYCHCRGNPVGSGVVQGNVSYGHAAPVGHQVGVGR